MKTNITHGLYSNAGRTEVVCIDSFEGTDDAQPVTHVWPGVFQWLGAFTPDEIRNRWPDLVSNEVGWIRIVR